MDMKTGEEDMDTFRQESQENGYDMDQGKNTCPVAWTEPVYPRLATHRRRGRLLLPPLCSPQTRLRDLNEPGETSLSSAQVQFVCELTLTGAGAGLVSLRTRRVGSSSVTVV